MASGTDDNVLADRGPRLYRGKCRDCGAGGYACARRDLRGRSHASRLGVWGVQQLRNFGKTGVGIVHNQCVPSVTGGIAR